MVKNENRLHNLYNSINGYLRYTESRNGVFLGVISFSAVLVGNLVTYDLWHKILVFMPIVLAAILIVISFFPVSGVVASKGKERYKRGNKFIKDGIKENILDPQYIAKLDTRIDRDRYFQRLGIKGIPANDHFLEYLFDHCIVTARKIRFKSILFRLSLSCFLLYIPICALLVIVI